MNREQSLAAIHACIGRLGTIPFRAPPPEPTTCCGKGCAGCVWQGYFDAVQWWLDDANELIQTNAASSAASNPL